MLSRSVQLRRIAAGRPLALAQWGQSSITRPFSTSGTLLVRRRKPSAKKPSDTLYTPDQMAALIRGSSPTIQNPQPRESTSEAKEQKPTPAVDQAQNQDESRNAAEPESTKSTTAEHEEMPDIENYEPTDAELAEMLSSAQATSSSDEGLSTAEAEAADMAARLAHNEYDTVASEDDLLFDTHSAESLPTSRPFNHELLTHQYVGASALGRPVEALIIKDPGRMKRSRKPIPVLESDAPDVSPAVELKWDDYVPKPDEEQDPVLEAWDNIDEMRPTDTNLVPAHEYHALIAALVEGFTQGQLSSYITMKLAQELEDEEAVGKAQMYPWIQKQSPWSPAYKIELESKTPKNICSAAIVDKIWKIEVREQVESLGRALLWLDPITFRLLTGHGRPVLEAIQREMLNPGNHERLAAKSEESRIGIYASKAAIPPIIAQLHEVAGAVTSAKLSTEYVKKENLTQPILDTLASITNTIIEKSSSGKELTVHWIADSDRPKPSTTEAETPSATPEGPADIVWRLLMAAQSASEAGAGCSSQAIIRRKQSGKAREAVFADYHREDRSKSWRDKLRSWTRLVGVVVQPDDRKKPQPLPLRSRIELEELPMPSTSDASTVSNLTAATFGHVLHPDDAATKSSKTATAKNRRILSPVIPHPAALTALSSGDEPVTQSTAIILKFGPDPAAPATAAGTLPSVRLTLPVDETADLSNFDFPPSSTLHAVTSQRVQDVLLPTESVDVRLTQQQLRALASDQPALRQFLAASEFNLLEGRLRTPSRIALALSAEATDVPYLFLGLEVHQAVETKLGGHRVRYESIEAGQHGGQRQELSLHRAVSNTSQESEDDGFLALVEAVAGGDVFSWNDGAARMQQRSTEMFSMDMLEESVEEEETTTTLEETNAAAADDDAVLVNEAGPQSKQSEAVDGEAAPPKLEASSRDGEIGTQDTAAQEIIVTAETTSENDLALEQEAAVSEDGEAATQDVTSTQETPTTTEATGDADAVTPESETPSEDAAVSSTNAVGSEKEAAAEGDASPVSTDASEKQL